MLMKFDCHLFPQPMSCWNCCTDQTISGAVSHRRVGNPKRCAAIVLDSKSYQWNIMSMDFARYYSWSAFPDFFLGVLFWAILGHVTFGHKMFWDATVFVCWKRSTAACFVGSRTDLDYAVRLLALPQRCGTWNPKVWRNNCEYNVDLDGKNHLVCRLMEELFLAKVLEFDGIPAVLDWNHIYLYKSRCFEHWQVSSTYPPCIFL